MTFTSVTLVEVLSCLISCFFLSNSPVPRRSLIVSLYYVVPVSGGTPKRGVRLTISKN